MIFVVFCFPIDSFFKLELVGQILLINASNSSLSPLLKLFSTMKLAIVISVEATVSSLGLSKVLIFLLLFFKEELMLTASL